MIPKLYYKVFAARTITTKSLQETGIKPISFIYESTVTETTNMRLAKAVYFNESVSSLVQIDTRNHRKPINSSKDLDFNLVSIKT